jgi:hypothetical protein
MANYAIVKDGIVKNVVIWNGQTTFSVEGSELVEATDNARIGGSWDGNVFTFVEPDPGPDTRPYDEKRKAEYPSIDELTVALWEGVVEERMAAVTSLEGKRQAVKAKYPK